MVKSSTKLYFNWTLQQDIQLQLTLLSVSKEFKVAKYRLVVTLRDSADQMVRDAGEEKRSMCITSGQQLYIS